MFGVRILEPLWYAVWAAVVGGRGVVQLDVAAVGSTLVFWIGPVRHMMGAVKAEAIRLIASLPEHCSLGDIPYHLYIFQKVRRGQTDVDEGRFVPQEEAERRIAQWGKSIGQNSRSTT